MSFPVFPFCPESNKKTALMDTPLTPLLIPHTNRVGVESTGTITPKYAVSPQDMSESSSDSPNRSEARGRWTTEEHKQFLEGLRIYGKEWKKVSRLVKTRTLVQIRTHAQKYFLKLEKSKTSGKYSPDSSDSLHSSVTLCHKQTFPPQVVAPIEAKASITPTELNTSLFHSAQVQTQNQVQVQAPAQLDTPKRKRKIKEGVPTKKPRTTKHKIGANKGTISSQNLQTDISAAHYIEDFAYPEIQESFSGSGDFTPEGSVSNQDISFGDIFDFMPLGNESDMDLHVPLDHWLSCTDFPSTEIDLLDDCCSPLNIPLDAIVPPKHDDCVSRLFNTMEQYRSLHSYTK